MKRRAFLPAGDPRSAKCLLVCVVVLAATFLLAPSALGDTWLPHTNGATWTYSWRDSAYAPRATNEKVTVKQQQGKAFTLAWTTEGLENRDGTVSGSGTVSFHETSQGLLNTDWSSTPPPATFPILCTETTSCGNSLAGVYYNIIWGSRSPTLMEPLLRGASWSSTGGAKSDVIAASDYISTALVRVPAFARPVVAAIVRSEITQAGAIGDPYGSGVRTVWWVWGVGPVKVVFHHGGGSDAPVTTAVLVSTTLTPKPPPSDLNYFPLRLGLKGRFNWTNVRHFKQPEIQSFAIDRAVNGSAQISVASVSGPIKTKAVYYYTLRADGLSNLAASASAASVAKLPPLGPRAAPTAKRRHFFTVFDLMNFGFNPVLPPYAVAGTAWSASTGTRDFDVYGVYGRSTVVGLETVRVPAGTFRALVVRTTLRQPGYPWGSGVRTCWFAPNRGLVKLVFEHGDGSVSRVALIG